MSDRRRQTSAARHKKRAHMIYDLLCAKNYTPLRAKEIAVLLDIPRPKRAELQQILDELVAEGKAEVNRQGQYQKKTSVAARQAEEGNQPSALQPLTPEQKKELREQRQQRALQYREQNGNADAPGADISEVVYAYDIPTTFPAKALRQAAACPAHLTEEDVAGRLDLRGQAVITIDGDDSKDLDDAISLRRDGSAFVLGVHIADVSAYVPDGSALDKEALRRGTSVYLADRVIPMLPEQLSNGICSLNEGQDRLTLSCMMHINAAGEVVKSRICESVICSAHRMTYSEVLAMFEERDPSLMQAYADVVPMLFSMRELAKKLAARRSKQGMIDFAFPETKFTLDEDGRPVRLAAAMPNEATRLIEQFMLTANETVAKTYFDRQIPFLYRTHEQPDGDKIEAVLTAVHALGVEASHSAQRITPKEVQALLARVQETPGAATISAMVLRAMQQARYTTVNSGHFGLASAAYCHFTSPIRRYPDLQIHRIMKDALHGHLGEKKRGYYQRVLPEVALRTSALERRAVEIERETNKLKMAEYAQDHVGEESDGVISGVTEWGFYVQRPDTLEGLVHVSGLLGEFYAFDEAGMRLVGKTSGRVFALGDAVRVRILRADPDRRIIDFALAR